MDFLTNPLNAVTLFPLIGVLLLLFMPSGKKNLLRWTALAASLATFGLSIWMLTLFRQAEALDAGALHLTISLPWIQVA
ncbi:MAG: hypothetical protein Q8N45_05120, partial [Anaerolineales bacterium]|nr:hypothetical protein [Anaerolineales bacterium]